MEQEASPTHTDQPIQELIVRAPMLHREEKIVIHVKPVANAPILKKNKFKVPGLEPFSTILNFIKQQIKAKDIFLYINSSFSPPPDAIIADLYECFKVGGELIVNYAITEAWG